MFFKQVSVFVENESGKLLDVIKLLGQNNIDIKALSIADTSNYGILRLILDKPNEAIECLKRNNFVVRINDVIAISIKNTPGALTKALEILKINNIDVSYLYAFVGTYESDASVMLKVSDLEKTYELFMENGIKVLNNEDVEK